MGNQNLENNKFALEDDSLLQVVIDSVPTPIFFKDSEGLYLGCNRAFEEYTGRSRHELIGKGVFELFEPELAKVYYEADKALFDSHGKQIYEAQVQYADGSIRDVMFHKAVFHAKTENIQGIVGAILDITKRKNAEAKLKKLALYDTLTGLENRYSLYKGLDHALKLANRHQHNIAVFMIDLDDFKLVNDTHGHAVGDAVLIEVAKRFRNATRESDIVARIGGDEFSVILENVENSQTLAKVADNILAGFSDPIIVGDHSLKINVSIGIVMSSDELKQSAELMKAADTALYAAKSMGKGSYQIFSGFSKNN